jgi:hypothetical protein
MRRMTKSRLQSSGARCAALVAAAGLALASAIPVAPMAPAAYSIPYEVWNLSGSDIKLYAYDSDPQETVHTYTPTAPPIGTIIKPGNKFHVDIVEDYCQTHQIPHITRAIPRFSGYDASPSGQAQNWRIVMERTDCETGIHCSVGGNPPPATQTAACGNYIGRGNNVATVAYGPGGETLTIPASDKAKQAEIDQAFCQNPYKDSLSIKCFDSPKSKDVYAGWTHWILLHQ